MVKRRRPLVYLSYRIKGSKTHALKLAEYLEQHGQMEVMADIDIPPGSHWPSVLQDALERAEAVLVLIDPEWIRYQDEWGRRRIDNPEDWVHKEALYGLTRIGKILPVLVEDARMPPSQALPEPLAPLAETQAVRLSLKRFEEGAEKVLGWVHQLHAAQQVGSLGIESVDTPPSGYQIRLDKLVINNFRCFESFEVDFTRESTLDGNWTCIVGLNGAGKTSVLQAISLLLMGPDYARELGGERLRSMRRLGPNGLDQREDAVLRAWLNHGGDEEYLEMTISSKGPRAAGTSGKRGSERSPALWATNSTLPVAGYGAGRNLSDSIDRWDGSSDLVLSQVSLFDPLARLIRAEELLQKRGTARRLFRELLERVFTDEAVRIKEDSRRTLFQSGDSLIGAHDLPDGFRSSVAWMASFCTRFAEARPSAVDLDDLTGIVLIDEIDLHLHASLQRKIVPRLRSALPNVQFVVTSHSPLVISSFDRNELVILDRNEADGQRHLDRQILSFSSDQIYDWLMETPPHSAALDAKVQDPSDPDLPILLYQTPEHSAKEAERRHRRQQAILQEMGFEDGTEV